MGGLLPHTPEFFDNTGFKFKEDYLVYKFVTIGNKIITHIDDDVTENVIKPTLLKNKENIEIIFHIHENFTNISNTFLRFFILTKHRDNKLFFQNAVYKYIKMCS